MSTKPTYEGLEQRVKELEKQVLAVNQTQKALQESEKKYRSLFDHMQNGFALHEIVLDENGKPVDYIFLDVNKVFERQIGPNKSDVIGKRVTELLPGFENDTANWIETYGKVALNGESISFDNFSDLLQKWYSVTAYRPGKGQFATIFTDITERIKTKETLQESEERFRLAFEYANSGMSLVAPDGHHLKVNSYLCDLLGYGHEELENMTVGDTTHPEDAHICGAFVHRALTGEIDSGKFETRHLRKDGQIIWTEIVTSLLRNLKGESLYFVAQVQDITKRKQAEENLRKAHDELEHNVQQRTAELLKINQELKQEIEERTVAEHELRESQYLLRTLIDSIEGVVFVKDTNGIYLLVNNAFGENFGIEPNDVIGKDDFSVFQPEVAEQLMENDKRIMASKKAETLEESGFLNGKSLIWETNKVPLIDENRNVYGICGIGFDITERKQAEEKLHNSEAKFKNLYELSPLPISVTDMETGRIIDVNTKLCEFTEYTREELIGRTAMELEFYSEHDRERFIRELSVSGEVKGLEMNFKAIDGSIRNMLMFATPIQMENKRCILTTIYDLTKQKHMQDQLQQLRKLEAIATLSGGIAHEFNNALTVVAGNIELLKMNLPDHESVNKFGQRTQESIQRLSKLTNKLLAYARGGKYWPERVNLSDFVRDALQIVEQKIDPDIKIEIDLQRNISNIKVDITHIQMALSAILMNSSEAIAGKGHIRISTGEEDIDEEFSANHLGMSPGSYVCLTIEDSGKGMDEETKMRIFEPFFTTKFQGRGLGMAAVYGIIKNHDGYIYVDSELDKGTLIRIFLPKAEPEIKEAKAPEAEVTRGTGTILVVEDEDMIMDVTRLMLVRLGYHVLGAKTGKEAIDIAKTFDGDIDLSLLDIKLPDMDGGKVYPIIKEARPNMSVIVCSGYSLDGDAQEILNAGAQGFIQKPFKLTELSARIKEQVDRRKDKRFKVKKDAVAILGTDPSIQCKIVDISKGGLAFYYSEEQDLSKEFAELAIYMAEEGFNLDKVPCRTISNLPITYESSLGYGEMERRSVQFGELTHNQIDQLEHLIQNLTIVA